MLVFRPRSSGSSSLPRHHYRVRDDNEKPREDDTEDCGKPFIAPPLQEPHCAARDERQAEKNRKIAGSPSLILVWTILTVLLLGINVLHHIASTRRVVAASRYLQLQEDGIQNSFLANFPFASSRTGDEGTAASPSVEAEHYEATRPPPTFPYQASPYAYAFLMAGCDPADADAPTRGSSSYRYMLYGVMVAARILRQTGSRADLLLLVEMLYSSPAARLPVHEERWLQSLGVQIKYLPKRPQQYFYRTQMDKFRILKWVQYRRIMFLDVDVLPTNNLDYLFWFSDPGDASSPTILNENIVLQDTAGPANGGTFVLTPHEGDIEAIQRIITRKETNLPFNSTYGWGHVIAPEEAWQVPSPSSFRNKLPILASKNTKRSTEWKFYAGAGDQGLLYYWVMHHKKNATVVFRGGGEVKNYGPHSDSNRDLTAVRAALQDPFRDSVSEPIFCWKDCQYHPFKDFVHFTANKKPWIHGLPDGFSTIDQQRFQSARHYWYATLKELDGDLQMNMNFSKTFPNSQQGKAGGGAGGVQAKFKPAHRHEEFSSYRRQQLGFLLTNLLE